MKRGGPLKVNKPLRSNSTLKVNKPLNTGSSTLKRSKINPVSKKMKDTLTDYVKVKRDKVNRESSECRGCGGPGAAPNSHIIGRSKREDLIAVPENITWHCRKCHDIWDGSDWGKKKRMNDFDSNMKYIQEVDPEYYQLLMTKADKI